MYKKIVDNYCTSIIVNERDVQKMRVLYGAKKTMSEWYKETKADVLINAALFDMKSGIPIENFVSNGKVINTSEWCNEGMGITSDDKIEFGNIEKNYRDFIVGFPVLVKNKKKSINFDIGSALTARNPRSLISYNSNTKEIILTTIDGRQNGKPGKTINETADYIMQFGVTNSINLDGGGSTQMLVNGEVVNSPSENRPVSNVIAIWFNNSIYRVQVGAFRNKDNANRLLKEVQKYFPEAFIKETKE